MIPTYRPIYSPFTTRLGYGGRILDLNPWRPNGGILFMDWSEKKNPSLCQTQTIRMSPPVLLIYPHIWHGGWEAGDKKIYLRYSHNSDKPSRPGYGIEAESPVLSTRLPASLETPFYFNFKTLVYMTKIFCAKKQQTKTHTMK